MKQVIVSGSFESRASVAREFLASRGTGERLLLVAGTADAASDWIRAAVLERGALLGWHRCTLSRLAAELAAAPLADAGLAPVGRLPSEGVLARVAARLGGSGELGRYTAVHTSPGFARAVCTTLGDLRHASVAEPALHEVAPELAALGREWSAALAELRLGDRARVFELAIEIARAGTPHPLLDLPTLWLDVAADTALERALIEAVAARAPRSLLTSPAGDALAAGAAPSGHTRCEVASTGEDSLARLQRELFAETAAPPEQPLDESVVVFSAPSETRECVEIARRVLAAAREGMPFDAMAVLVRSPEEYRAHLSEAFARAGIPAHFARGARRPDPAGRAFTALLACAAEGLSARRFAEYLSLAQVPDATRDGVPPPAVLATERWVPPDEELIARGVAEAIDPAAEMESLANDTESRAGLDPESAPPVIAGTLRAPRRWEQILVEASVIGGLERWRRRLAGHEAHLRLQLDEARRTGEERGVESLERELGDLAALRAYALPLLESLTALPRSATWGAWIDALGELASRALRRPTRVLATLQELAPMADLGEIDLAEVRGVLGARLLEVAVPPRGPRYGAVYVAPADAARGMSFELVFVPGLAEKLFPRKIAEDPILLDALRTRLDASLATNASRVARERLALRIAVGAARRRLVLSYPRLDLDRSRPRVPSLYALEALRAAEGSLPDFEALSARAERVTRARVGWPAPARPEDAIDEAEHDLALLERLLRQDESQSVGTARYLIGANPHLGRALRTRARRWHRNWTLADGLIAQGGLPAGAAEWMATQQLDARSYSPTALQHFAACPYKFFLQAVHRLAPRVQVDAIDELDPLERGSLVHETQLALFEALEAQSLLPVRPENLESARSVLERVLDDVAVRYRDRLAPAIDRVWDDGIAQIRVDLREWLRRAALDGSGLVPWRFELAFGLPSQLGRDARSSHEAVTLDSGLRVRGSIDLIERDGERLRVTDHKTGRERVKSGAVIDGGHALQPVLYALVVEKLFPEQRVESGRLYYCTSAGGYSEVTVPLDERARGGAELVARTLGAALREPFLPAFPEKDGCRWCDYQVVCGPYEELRTKRKPRERERIVELIRLRKNP